MKYSIEEIKKGMTILIKLLLIIIEMFKKFNVAHIVAIGTILWEGRGIDFKLMWTQVKDLDVDEGYDLAAHFREEAFDIPDDVIEAKIEALVDFLPQIYDLVDDVADPIKVLFAEDIKARDRVGAGLKAASTVFDGWSLFEDFIASIKDLLDGDEESEFLEAGSEKALPDLKE